VPLDFTALHELKAGQERLLDAIDNLRSLELGKDIDLPQLIVVGEQNSGKSSALEGISQVRFHVDHKVCSRFPMDLIPRRSHLTSVNVEITPRQSREESDPEVSRLAAFQRTSFDIRTLPQRASEAAECMGILPKTDAVPNGSKPSLKKPRRFSDDVLLIKISGQDQPHLTW
jgi:hypothetical protein